MNFNGVNIVKLFREIREYTVHVTQVIDLCPKELIYSNISNIVNIPTVGHIYPMTGTAVHKYISDYINGKEKDIDYYTKDIPTEVGKFKHAINNFKKWFDKNKDNYSELMSEVNNSEIIHESNNYRVTLTGTTDLIAKDLNGNYHVFDFKTSKTTMMIDKYTEQLGGYSHMFNDLSFVDGRIVILGSHNYKDITVNINKGRELFENKIVKILDIINDIREGQPINVNVTFRCVMCRYRTVCDGSSIQGDGVEDISVI